ncbi:Hypothetical predicted protein [Olea europaea subsp. europaea]|uniref:Uncharacterized protein n=1 Tax=Olea europaea subsp. europaea TaxID=158383 RepID=A0A8S0SM80_OLEEU|nr:Hypothetical predicted protein [Olea europaea subsp. europaea]
MASKTEEEISLDDLFDLTMKKKWNKVETAYKQYPSTCRAKLTKSEETALHLAISSYHSKLQKSDFEKQIEEMIKSIPEKDAFEILSMKNDQGDTPLHLAAAVGWPSICECIALRDRELISTRNLKEETPLFVAAYHGKLDCFLTLHHLYSKKSFQETDQQKQGQETHETLCRREDGLAYQIISHYPKLINSVNVEGESPLHVLARKPNVFRSITHFRFPDSIIYRCEKSSNQHNII